MKAAAAPLPILQCAPPAPAGSADPAAADSRSPFAFLLPASPAAAPALDATALAAALAGEQALETRDALDGETTSPLLLWLPWMAPPADAAATAPLDGELAAGPALAGSRSPLLPGLANPAGADPLLSSAAPAMPGGVAVPAVAAAAAQAVDPAAELARQLASLETMTAGGGESAPDAGDARTTDGTGAARSSTRAIFDLGVPTSPTQRFADALADGVEGRLQWMAEQGVGRARIRLSPAELGTIDIQLQMDGKQVRAEFSSANADVRQALESQLPRLREMFLSQGMTLTQADVGHRQETHDGQPGPHGDGLGGEGEHTNGELDSPGMTALQLRQRIGLLDEYA